MIINMTRYPLSKLLHEFILSPTYILRIILSFVGRLHPQVVLIYLLSWLTSLLYQANGLTLQSPEFSFPRIPLLGTNQLLRTFLTLGKEINLVSTWAIQLKVSSLAKKMLYYLLLLLLLSCIAPRYSCAFLGSLRHP